MVCYSDGYKACAAKIVGGISGILALLGVITAILGAMQMGVVSKPNEWAGIDALDQSGFGTGVLILGIFTILLGLLGFATCKCKKAWFAVPFVILTMIIGLVMLIIGVIILGVVPDFIDQIQTQICAEVNKDSGNHIMKQYNDVVEQVVCSEACPCPAGEDGVFQKKWEAYGEDVFNKYGRTIKNTDKMTKMKWESDSNKKTYDSWRKCYDGVLKAKMATDKSQKMQELGDFVNKGGLDFLADSEAKLECAGLCTPGLFYATLSIEKGRPTQDCLNAGFDSLQGEAKPAGLISIVTGIILLFAMVMSFPLCSGFSDQEAK